MNHLIISFSIMGDCTCAASLHHLQLELFSNLIYHVATRIVKLLGKIQQSKGCYLHMEPSSYRTCARVSQTIILDELQCLELGRHNDLWEVGQTIQINTSMGAGALYDMKLLSQGFHLALNLVDPRFGVLVLKRICFLVIVLGQYIVALILFWWGLIYWGLCPKI